MRPNDTTKGRAIKLTHYIDLHKRLYGVMPDDIHLFVRNNADRPYTPAKIDQKEEVMNMVIKLKNRLKRYEKLLMEVVK